MYAALLNSGFALLSTSSADYGSRHRNFAICVQGRTEDQNAEEEREGQSSEKKAGAQMYSEDSRTPPDLENVVDGKWRET